MTSKGDPFFFKEGKTAILLIHGWSSTPQEIRELGEYLAKEGFTVKAPLLKGHGTHPDNLSGIQWEEWLEQFRNEFLYLAEAYNKVWIGGSSLGGNLSLQLASSLPVAGVIALATPIHIRFQGILSRFLRFIKPFKRSLRKRYPPNVNPKLIDSKVHYWSYPISSMEQALKCIHATIPILEKVVRPALIMQSSTDHMLSKENAEFIYNSIKSATKRLVWVPDSYHVFTIDHWRKEVFRVIADFMKQNS